MKEAYSLGELEAFNINSVDHLDSHQIRVKNLAVLMLLAMTGELPLSYEESQKNLESGIKFTERATAVENGARFHDIGKLFLSDKLVQKPGPLDPKEIVTMRTHPMQGFLTYLAYVNGELDRDVTDALLAFGMMRTDKTGLVGKIIWQHHENWNGSGYPLGLDGENIAFEARLVHVVDVYDALRDPKRVYRKPVGKEEALDIIREQSGIMFNPKIANRFVEIKKEGYWDDLEGEYSTGGQVDLLPG